MNVKELQSYVTTMKISSLSGTINLLLLAGYRPTTDRRIKNDTFFCDNFSDIITVGCSGGDWLNLHFSHGMRTHITITREKAIPEITSRLEAIKRFEDARGPVKVVMAEPRPMVPTPERPKGQNIWTITQPCKRVRFFPGKDKLTGEIIFFSVKDLIFKLIIQHGIEQKDHVITYNDTTAKYTYTWPCGEKTQYGDVMDLHELLAHRDRDLADRVCEQFAYKLYITEWPWLTSKKP